jgi:hypothetical protein
MTASVVRFPLGNRLRRAFQLNYNSRNLSPEGVRHCGLNGTFQIPKAGAPK